jgi:hypothetical protein
MLTGEIFHLVNGYIQQQRGHYDHLSALEQIFPPQMDFTTSPLTGIQTPHYDDCTRVKEIGLVAGWRRWKSGEVSALLNHQGTYSITSGD